ncbi:protein phosphatase 1L-like [Chironomus tepperi]|uniref:protein phosphatase 1L-like n=1 Tax=Chironomus tepperi TaxID=113505 RepID=UPI00391F2C83
MSHYKYNSSWCTEEYKISNLCCAGGVSFQGRSNTMEDTFKVIPNIKGTDVSIFGIFDGHAGEFASKYACDIIMPCISDKIANVLSLIEQKSTKLNIENNNVNVAVKVEEEFNISDTEAYITHDNKINYELLLNNEILNGDKILNERLSKAALFCGTTFCLVLVDITNKTIICANVGDSRAVLCNTKGNAVQLSYDHKPNNPDELKRIQENGGYVTNKEGCWRVSDVLATSRSIGDYPLKLKKVIIATPDFQIMKYKDFRFFPKFIILATDGVWDVISNQSACDYVKEKIKEQHCGAKSLVKKAYARKSEDNISAIIIRFIKPKKIHQKSSFDPYVGTYEWLR